MKAVILILSLFFAAPAFSQINWDVNQVALKSWNTPDGIPYMRGPGINLGATSFQVMDDTRLALLCNSSGEIVLINRSNNSIIDRLPVVFAPRDFVFDNGLFYVLYTREIVVYNAAGSEKARYPFPDRYQGVERLTRYNHGTYLLLPSGNCCLVQNDNEALKTTQEFEGWITASGNFIATRILENTYFVKVITPQGKTFSRTFTTGDKAAGAFVVGCTANRITLDIQTFLSEAPISVERRIVSVELRDDGIGDISNSKTAINCYYVLAHRDWELLPDNTVYNMVTAPDGLYIFSLKETTTETYHNYPPALLKMRYHFNNNLVKVD